MDRPEPQLPAKEQQSIDRAVAMLVNLLRTAVAEKRHGTTGLRVSIHDGEIRTFYETSEFAMK